MIELKNSKTTYLGKASGGDQYSLDAFIGAVQMREPGGQWQDIKPRLVRDADGWHIEGAPYYAEVKDDGTRLFCPDSNERSRYLRLPAPALFSGLEKNIVSNPARLDGLLLPNQITMPADWGEFRIIFGNTGMYFEVLFTKSPPADLFGRDSPRILLDVETVDCDIAPLLASRSGLGIPPPRLIAADGEISVERRLDWSYKNGQLELGLDFGNLPFPILLKNTTVDVQVGASADDVTVSAAGTFDDDATITYVGRENANEIYSASHRFDGITIAQSSTIDVCYVSFYEYASNSGALTNLFFEEANDPDAPTSQADYMARNLTEAFVAWDGDLGPVGWRNSPSLVTPCQEVINAYGLSNQAMQVFHKDDGSPSNSNRQRYYSWDYSDHTYGAKLHIEYTAGGPTEKTATETGMGTEARQSFSADLARGEAGSGSDARQLFLASLIKADSGGGSEQSLLSLLLASADNGQGIEGIIALLTGLTKAESGVGVDGISARGMVFQETGSGADGLVALLASIVRGETGSGFDQSLLTSFVARQSAETGSGSDVAALIARLSALESGSGVDAGWLVGLKNILSGDLGGGRDVLKALIAASRAGSDMKLPGRPGHVRIPSRGVSL